MDYAQALLLHCIERFRGERSANAAFYLLKGKKSAQTIQDASWYSLRNVFSSLPVLSKDDFNRMIEQLLRNRFILLENLNVYVTEAGKDWLNKTFDHQPFPKWFNGWKYSGVDEQFWKRISLLVQTISYWSRYHSDFLPVQRDLTVQFWAKNWLKQIKGSSREKLAYQFYEELRQILSAVESLGVDPNLFLLRLSGYETTGYTPFQIAKSMKMDEDYYTLLFRGIIHYMIDSSWKEKRRYVLLSTIVQRKGDLFYLTKSSLLTYRFIREGKTLDEIVHLRKLKRSTIEDHIVEIAVKVPNFSIDDYVPIELQQKIVIISDRLQTRKLKNIKDSLHEADYFSIRLVLSKIDDIRKRLDMNNELS
ncbi:helix-turn-helix domain-containing protein [Fervidibacillus halotolerans]|uniref:Helix-turn-helix domain-containing protein n=1 Tax=Fervidibacillus halotolerans TaxID=2980027 RepID=A0A9E8M1H9_9BACI|nr:helix-turn-helix domain-containing protein [Fervidibacillus halotolerans]WAA13793.1 helix-turn-helix domain-containing protein [Fervidibacillus halotolerans]